MSAGLCNSLYQHHCTLSMLLLSCERPQFISIRQYLECDGLCCVGSCFNNVCPCTSLPYLSPKQLTSQKFYFQECYHANTGHMYSAITSGSLGYCTTHRGTQMSRQTGGLRCAMGWTLARGLIMKSFRIHPSSSNFPCVTQTRRIGPLEMKLHEFFRTRKLKLCP